MSRDSLFLSTPISSFQSEYEYARFRDWLERLLIEIDQRQITDRVFAAAMRINKLCEIEDAVTATQEDLSLLETCTRFLLIYPKPSATSALIELGFAIARNISILVVHPYSAALPFLLREINRVRPNIRVQCIAEFDDDAIGQIATALSRMAAT